jgi:peptidoglycan/xylan/chitin deacetylase (PgdA/CDA1 family)
VRRALVALACAAGLAAAGPAHAATTVSLTFDDGVADQLNARPVLAAHGMHATFYVISRRVGHTRYLSVADLRSLQGDGNEIGGHTENHVHVSQLTPFDLKRQICGDRFSLMADGLNVRSFAYPFSDINDSAKQTVQACGYESGRTSSGIAGPTVCTGCPFSETIPPRDPYAMRAPDSVEQAATVDSITQYVKNAQAHGGGWVMLVFHHICDGCNAYGISADEFSQVLDWLASQPDVSVQTVGDVVGGPVNPAVPAPPLTPVSASNLLQNASLEIDEDQDGTPDCFQLGQTGTNAATWSRVPGHTGSVAEKVTITDYSVGDRKLVSRQDAGLCAPRASGGRRYAIRAWYRASAPAKLVAYVRDADGRWRFFGQGPVLQRSTSWRQAHWTPKALPAGSTALSVGMSLRARGSLTLDDIGLALA